MLTDIESLSQLYLPNLKNIQPHPDYGLSFAIGLVGLSYLDNYDGDDENYLDGLMIGRHYKLVLDYWKKEPGNHSDFYEYSRYDDKQEMAFLLYAIRYFNVDDLKVVQSCTRSKSIYFAAAARLAELLKFDYP